MRSCRSGRNGRLRIIKINSYNDGLVLIYQGVGRKTDFNAKKNEKGLKDLDFVVKLPFTEKSVRQQDQEYFDQSSTKRTMKVVTPLVKCVTNKQKAVIEGYLYSITHISPNRSRNELYIYLEGEREIAE